MPSNYKEICYRFDVNVRKYLFVRKSFSIQPTAEKAVKHIPREQNLNYSNKVFQREKKRK